MRINFHVVKSTIVGALGGLLFGFDTAYVMERALSKAGMTRYRQRPIVTVTYRSRPNTVRRQKGVVRRRYAANLPPRCFGESGRRTRVFRPRNALDH